MRSIITKSTVFPLCCRRRINPTTLSFTLPLGATTIDEAMTGSYIKEKEKMEQEKEKMDQESLYIVIIN